MLMLRFLFTVALALSLPFSAAFAADSASSLAAIEKALAHPEMLVAQFTVQKTVPGFKSPLTSTGRLFLWDKHGLFWETKTPFSEAILFTERGVVKQDESGPQAFTENPRIGQIMQSLLSASEQSSDLTRQFFLTAKSDKKGNWSLIASPKSDLISQLISEIALYGNRFIERVTLTDVAGNISRIAFTRTSECTTVPADIAPFFEKAEAP